MMLQQPTTPEQVLEEITAIYEGRATGRYGLTSLNQLAHAVQSGHQARIQDFKSSLIVAALLHDMGHMVHRLGEHPAASGIDDCHEKIGADWLARYFGPEVTEPIRLHVAAKRYLCTVDPSYVSKLSQDSIESLALQGGSMSEDELTMFTKEEFWEDAVALRRIDDMAKDPNGHIPSFAEFNWYILQLTKIKKVLAV
jgi:predicted HD phosphohydrolase